MNKNKVGLTLGALLALWHLVWGIMVALHWAQPFLNWIYKLHFLNNPFKVGVFNITTTITLMVVTFIFGYIFGWVFVYLWETIKKR